MLKVRNHPARTILLTRINADKCTDINGEPDLVLTHHGVASVELEQKFGQVPFTSPSCSIKA